MDNGFIWLVPLKTRRFDPNGEGITIPIHPELREVLTRQKQIQKPESAFVVGELLAKKSLSALDHGANRLLAKLLGESGTHFTMHCFRHTFISNCINGGAPAEVVGSMVGHSSVQMTRHYTHIYNESKVKAVNAMTSSAIASCQEPHRSYTDDKRQLLVDKLAELPSGVVDILLKALGGDKSLP